LEKQDEDGNDVGTCAAAPHVRAPGYVAININSILIRTGYGYFGPPTGRSTDAAKFDRPPNHPSGALRAYACHVSRDDARSALY
jgi:hypothetical protein